MELKSELCLVEYELKTRKEAAERGARQHALELRRMRDDYERRLRDLERKNRQLELEKSELICQAALMDYELRILKEVKSDAKVMFIF